MNKFPFLLICLLFAIVSCSSQEKDFLYKKIPQKYKSSEPIFAFKSNDGSVFDLTNFLPENYLEDASQDYTEYLQHGIDTYDKIIFPNFPILINEKGLRLRSNTTVYFPEKSLLILKPNKLPSYKVLLMEGIGNVIVYNLKIKGDRETHLNDKGEWGMGLSILGSKNITILNPEISYCWGDGIYLGNFNEKNCQDIKIENAKLDYNRRNGISIVSCDDLQLINPLVSNTYGTAPMSGIDIEPNHDTDVINDIQISNPITFNNARDGILIVLTRLTHEKRSNKVNINITNHIDDSSNSPVRLGSGFRKNNKSLNGSIRFTNSTWIDNVTFVKLKGDYSKLPQTFFTDVKIIQNDLRYKNKQEDDIKKINLFVKTQNNIKINYK